MEEKIYDRQVRKESLAGRLIDEHQIERYIRIEEDYLYCTKNLHVDVNNKPPTFFPEDDFLLASVLNESTDSIWSVHKHDALLEHKLDEDLSEEEQNAAWASFKEAENLRKKLPKMVQNQIIKELLPTKLTICSKQSDGELTKLGKTTFVPLANETTCNESVVERRKERNIINDEGIY